MKTFNTILLMSALICFYSCGKAGTKAQLKISSGFLAANASYDGGLIVVGKNQSNNESFSITIDSGFSTSVILNKGNWTFAAVGWAGEGAPIRKFSGAVECGVLQQNIENINETVNLNVSSSSCNHPFFTNGTLYDAGANSFRNLSLIASCNSFYNNSSLGGSINGNTVTSGTSESYCQPGSVPDDWVSEVRGVKIQAINKNPSDNGLNPGIGTNCLSNSANAMIDTMAAGQDYYGLNFRLPTKGIPFIISIYRDVACSDIITSYSFVEGLDVPNKNFDHLIFTRASPSGHMRLLLPGNEVRRAYSPFMAIMPAVKCSSSKCDTVPGNAVPEYHGFDSGTTNRFRLKRTNCPSSITSTLSGFTGTCAVSDPESVEITYMAPVAGVGTITLGANAPYASSIVNVIVSSNVTFEMEKYSTYGQLVDRLGPSDPNYNFDFFNNNSNHGDEDKYGKLSRVRDMLSASGPGGLFQIADPSMNFQQACMAITGTESIQLYDPKELRLQSYRINITNSPLSAPSNYICDTNNRDATTCVFNSFDKKMTIYDLSYSAVSPTIVIEFSCNNKIGRFESADDKTKPSKREIGKEIIIWNTEPSNAQQRYESLTLGREYDSSNNLVNEYRDMSRVSKTNTQNFEILSYQFSANWNGSVWNQGLTSYQISSDNSSICYKQTSASPHSHASDPYDIFSYGGSLTVRQADPYWSTNIPNRFYLAGNYNTQSNAGTCPTAFSAALVNNSFINGTLMTELDSLRNTFFENNFGTSFMNP